MSKPINVLIAEDHEVVREGLKILITADPGLRVAGEAANGEKAVRLARELQPDVVLMDLAMPGGNGLQATKSICSQVHGPKVLVLSAYQDEETVQEVIDAGVAGYITKHSAAEELLTAIHEIGNGRVYYGAAIASKLKARRRLSFQHGWPEVKSCRLTSREKEVLGLIATGLANKQIAGNLGVSIKTVEKHRQATMDKLNIHDTAGLTRYAMSRGIVPSRSDAAPQASP